jgi:hypothetical protein
MVDDESSGVTISGWKISQVRVAVELRTSTLGRLPAGAESISPSEIA